MDVHSRSSRAGAAAAATALLLCTSLAAADAASSARVTSGTVAATSGSWGAVATTSMTPPYGTGPLSLTFTLFGTTARYFNVVNTGTLPLTAEIYRATTSGTNADIEMCSTTWNESTGSCPSGVITTVTTTGDLPKAFTAPLPATGSAIRLRARITGLLLSSTTVTIGVNVARAQARTASVTGS